MLNKKIYAFKKYMLLNGDSRLDGNKNKFILRGNINLH